MEPIQVSVVIVNYNVRHFLEQCLHSVFQSLQKVSGEVFVVDNSSVDGSCAMVRQKFPLVHLLANERNLGFSAANNQAIRMARGRYILLLNPDTVVEEDSLAKVVAFMDTHPDAGGLGVKMIDGRGNFLPESKRGLPTPRVALCKMTGLSALFPRSKYFGHYHLGYLDPEQTHRVEVLSGAFMLLRAETLARTGLLDEAYFMYGEDIDLSYRITQAGYQNYYYPGTTIIHYKGESTKKSSVNYVLVFYQAMIIFAKKHFSGTHARKLSLLIRMAVYLRAFLAILHRTGQIILVPALDAIFIMAGFLLFKPFWESFRLNGGHYPWAFLWVAVPLYTLVWLVSMAVFGGYDKPIRLGRIARGLLAGTVIILTGYSLLPESMRFSRALILIGLGWNLLTLPLWRVLAGFLKWPGMEFHSGKPMNLVIVGDRAEASRVAGLLNQTDIHFRLTGLVSPEFTHEEGFLGHLDQMEEIVSIHHVEEIVFCSATIPARRIISTMHRLSNTRLRFKIAGPESLSVIGSNSIDTAGDLYAITNNSIGKSVNQRKKRIFDLSLAGLLVMLLPVLKPFGPSFHRMYGALGEVLKGRRTWVGYSGTAEGELLPPIRPGVFSPAQAHRGSLAPGAAERLDLIYSKNYSMLQDLRIILKCLGRSSLPPVQHPPGPVEHFLG